MPRVSVIIPNYNHDRFLEHRIQSILDQTYQDFEIILLDDLSTDRSREIINNFSTHPKVSHIVFNKINSNSTFKQWNKGFRLATGKYVWIAESDDYAAPQFLEKSVAILEKNDRVGLVYCQSFLVNEKNDIIDREFLACTDCFDLNRWNLDYLNDGKNECSDYLAGKNTIPNASAVLIRKAIYESEIDGENEVFKVAGDWFTWSKILLKADIYFISESLNYFRVGNASVSRNTAKLPLVIQESLAIFSQIQDRVAVSDRAKKIFFELVSSWWLSYFITGNNFNWGKEIKVYQQLMNVASDRRSTFYFHWQILLLPLTRSRYMLKLGTRVSNLKNKILQPS